MKKVTTIIQGRGSTNDCLDELVKSSRRCRRRTWQAEAASAHWSQSILKLHSFCGEAWEQWHPLPLPKNKGAVGTDSNPPFSPVGAELGGGVKDTVNAPGHLKFLLQDWGKSESRLRKVKVASRVMNARHDPPPDQKAASLPMAPQMFSTPSSIPLQSATSSSPSESSPGGGWQSCENTPFPKLGSQGVGRTLAKSG